MGAGEGSEGRSGYGASPAVPVCGVPEGVGYEVAKTMSIERLKRVRKPSGKELQDRFNGDGSFGVLNDMSEEYGVSRNTLENWIMEACLSLEYVAWSPAFEEVWIVGEDGTERRL